MVDGFKTSCLPIDVPQLAKQYNIKLNGQTVYVKDSGLIFGFDERVDTSTGELHNVCTLRGSLHKYKNLGAHNADRFYLSEVSRVLDELKERCSIDANSTLLYRFEAGVNIRLPYPPQRVLNAIRLYKNARLAPMGKIGLVYETEMFKFKIYDKGKQCDVLGYENILRIEISMTANYLKRNRKGHKVLTLADLVDPNLWEWLETQLIKAIDNTVIVEAMPGNGLNKREKDVFELFLGDGWQALDRKNLHKKKARLNELIDRTGSTAIKNQIRELASNECKSLRTGDKVGLFESGNLYNKTNNRDKSNDRSMLKLATKSGFSDRGSKPATGDKIGIKIKAVNVATDPPLTAPTQPGKAPPLLAPKISDNEHIRGKPPESESEQAYNTQTIHL